MTFYFSVYNLPHNNIDSFTLFCFVAECSVPTVPNSNYSANLNPTEDEGASITISCEKDYAIEGRNTNALTVTCQSDGEWSPNVPRCIRKH